MSRFTRNDTNDSTDADRESRYRLGTDDSTTSDSASYRDSRDSPDTDGDARYADTTSSSSTDSRYADSTSSSSTGSRYADGDGATRADDRRPTTYADTTTEEQRHDKFGGFNIGAAFFGWLVAVAFSILLAGIVGAVAAAIGESVNLTQSDAERDAGTYGLATAIALLVVLMIGYYAGGYVAGRMSRYDGGRQGMGVWVIGLLVTLAVALVGWIFGSKYDIFQRVDLPSIPLPSETITTGGIILGAAVILGTLLAALAGGKAGHHYHRKIDRFTA